MFARRPPAYGSRGVVAAGHPLASLAGIRMLAAGGNAVDATIAASAALTVAEPFWSGPAGAGIALMTSPGRRPRVLDFLPVAPAAATHERVPFADRDTGALACAVPGLVAGWCRLHQEHGSLPLATLFDPAIEVANRGFVFTEYERTMYEVWGNRVVPECGRDYKLQDGTCPPLGELIVQRDLGETLRRIGQEGAGCFYEGDIAKRIVRYLADRGGVMTEEDLRRYPSTVRWVDAVAIAYGDRTIYTSPPPTSAVQVFHTLLSVAGSGFGKGDVVDAEHVVPMAEASRLSRVIAAEKVGDPRFVPDLVASILGEDVERSRAQLADPASAPRTGSAAPGSPVEGGGTSVVSVMDSSGTAICMIQSLAWGFGNGLVVDGTGIALNNACLFTDPNPGRQNSLEPRKAPEWPIAPLMIYERDDLRAAFGSPGAYGITTTTPFVVSNYLDYGLSLQEAIGVPRYRWADDPGTPLPARKIVLESRLPASVVDDLRGRGYDVELAGDFSWRLGSMTGFEIDAESGWLLGVADPRRAGYAMGY